MPGPLLALAPLLMNDRFRSQIYPVSRITAFEQLVIYNQLDQGSVVDPTTNDPIPSSVSLWKKPTELEII
jgi:hypothetical protein